MKTRPSRRGRKLQLNVTYRQSYYIDLIARLETILRRKPYSLQIDMIGVGEIPADAALLIRSVLLTHARNTRLIINARSSLQGGSVLVWLLGEIRSIREDALLYFRHTTLSEQQQAEQLEALNYTVPKYQDSYSDPEDPEEWDYVRVLQLINEFLPVKELAGRPIGTALLRQFGLIENEKVDGFL